MCDHIDTPHASNMDEHHDKEHNLWSRRAFLRSLGIVGGATLMAGKIPLTAYATSPLAFGLSGAGDDNILVMIRLQGGNDGLNTIIPVYDYGRYQSLRPGIAIPEGQTIPLTGELGMHPALGSFKTMWDQGRMKLLNNVGYPDQNLSHFRSSDIWASASDAADELDTGWMGRFYDDTYPDFLLDPPPIPPAIQIGGGGDLVFNGEDNVNYAISVPSPEQLEYIASSGALYDPSSVPPCLYGDQLSFMRTITNNTFKYAAVISEAFARGENAAEYQGPLGRQLEVIARLIKGQLGTRLYVVTLNGFDTHAGQLNQHQNLLSSLANNVAVFFQDLSQGGWDEKVMSFTFSEFGRRPAQNASQGTDHGAAAPMFVLGPGLMGNGSFGSLPQLNDLDQNGNLKYDIDFRSVYATMLEKWLCVDPAMVDLALGQPHARLDLGFNCTSVSTSSAQHLAVVKHEARYDRGLPHLFFKLPYAGNVKIELLNAMGQSFGIIYEGIHDTSGFTLPISSQYARIPGYYFYRMKYNGKTYSGKILME